MPFDEGAIQSVETANRRPARLRRRRFAQRTIRARARPSLAANPARSSPTNSLGGGIVTACAWLVPETAASAVLGLARRQLLVYSVRLRPPVCRLYLGGAVGHAIAFYWVFPTVSTFGGFGIVISGLIFGVFVVTGALLFFVFAFFHRNLPPVVDRFALRHRSRSRSPSW